MAVISLDLSSTFRWPKVNPVVEARLLKVLHIPAARLHIGVAERGPPDATLRGGADFPEFLQVFSQAC